MLFGHTESRQIPIERTRPLALSCNLKQENLSPDSYSTKASKCEKRHTFIE
ncbi:hypothetical protein C4K26_3242 [Pseudomonas chlororaphis]|nr:hypothetical protein C4K26_3242 [Pseudomonas chlororaphis]